MVRRTTIRKRMRASCDRLSSSSRAHAPSRAPNRQWLKSVVKATTTTTRYRKPRESGGVSGSGAGALVANYRRPGARNADLMDAHPRVGSTMVSSTASAPSLPDARFARLVIRDKNRDLADQRPSGSVAGRPVMAVPTVIAETAASAASLWFSRRQPKDIHLASISQSNSSERSNN